MSQRHAVQDATGVIASGENGDLLIVALPEDPTSTSQSKPGYSKGCLFIDTAGAKLYVNGGTELVSTFAEAT